MPINCESNSTTFPARNPAPKQNNHQTITTTPVIELKQLAIYIYSSLVPSILNRDNSSSVLSNALENGESVSFPSDRVLKGQRTIECPFMGTPAQFPLGPFALAVQRDIAVLCVNVMKVSTKKYKVYVSRLQKEGDTKKDQMASLAHQFVGHLEDVLKQYPEQWFNHYEFWND